MSVPSFLCPRQTWDPLGKCLPRQSSPTLGTVQAAVVHHSYIPGSDYTAEEVPKLIQGVFQFHHGERKWDDIGYNFFVDKFGGVYEGRKGGAALPISGAHTAGFNGLTFGVCVLGDYRFTPPPEPALSSLAKLLAWKLALHGVPATGTVTLTTADGAKSFSVDRICGHRDLNPGGTECPGQALYDLLPQLRLKVAKEMAANQTSA